MSLIWFLIICRDVLCFCKADPCRNSRRGKAYPRSIDVFKCLAQRTAFRNYIDHSFSIYMQVEVFMFRIKSNVMRLCLQFSVCIVGKWYSNRLASSCVYSSISVFVFIYQFQKRFVYIYIHICLYLYVHIYLLWYIKVTKISIPVTVSCVGE